MSVCKEIEVANSDDIQGQNKIIRLTMYVLNQSETADYHIYARYSVKQEGSVI